MGGKIKNLIHKIFSDKRALLFSLALVLFLALTPLYQTHAFFGEIIKAITGLPVSVPTLMVAVPLYVLAAGLGLINALLSNVMVFFARATLSIPVIPSGGESIVDIGWSLSQQITNILFILILVFIGLGTILRLQTYQLQKTLPALIMIAILVNFSGVLVGFVVDLGNLFTNFFLSQAFDFGGLGATLGNIGLSLGDMVTAGYPGIFGQAAGLILQIAVTMIYYVISILILFVIMALFFFRVVILWILVILAPFAFAAYILPATKKWWSQWWQQLIQWSIIGIPISFFLFLASRLLQTHPDFTEIERSLATSTAVSSFSLEVQNAFSKTIQDVLAPFASLLMLMVGVMLSMQMAPAGAQGVINLAKKAGMAAGKTGALRLGRRVATSSWAGKAMEKATRLESLTGGRYGKSWFGKTGFGKKLGAVASAPEKWMIRKAGEKGLDFKARIPGAIDEERKNKELQNLVKTEKWGELARRYSSPLASPERKLAIATLLAQEKGQKGLAKLGGKNVEEALRLAANRSPKDLKSLVAADPRLAKLKEARNVMVDPTDPKDKRDMGKVKKELGIKRDLDDVIRAGKDDPDYIKISEKLAFRNAVKGLKVDQIENLSDDILKNEEFQEEFVLNKGTPHFARVEEKHGPEYVRSFDAMRQKLWKENPRRLVEENPAMIKASLTGNMRHLFTDLKNPDTGKDFRDVKDANRYISKVLGEKEPPPEELLKVGEEDAAKGGEIRSVSRQLGETRRKKESLKQEGGSLQRERSSLEQERNDLQKQIGTLPMNQWPADLRAALGEKENKIRELGDKIKKTENDIEGLGETEKQLIENLKKVSFTPISEEIASKDNLSLLEKEITKADKDAQPLRDQISRLKAQVNLHPNLPGEGNRIRQENLARLTSELENKEGSLTTLKTRAQSMREQLTLEKAVELPPSLPTITKDMPKGLRKLIQSGEKEREIITQSIGEAGKLREVIREIGQSRADLFKELEGVNTDIKELNDKEKTATLSAEELSNRDGLKRAARETEDKIKDHNSLFNEKMAKLNSDARDILERKGNFESSLREPIDKVKKEWEEKKDRDQKTKNINKIFKKIRKR